MAFLFALLSGRMIKRPSGACTGAGKSVGLVTLTYA